MEPSAKSSQTPILDRLQPLPKLTPPGTGSAFMLGVWIIVSFGIVAAWIFWHPGLQESVRQLIAEDRATIHGGNGPASLIILLALSVLAGFAAVAVHEMGHVLGGLCAGFRFNSIRVGPLEFHRPFGFSLYRGSGKWSGGWVNTYPTRSDHLAERALVLVISGPAASILSAFIVLASPIPKGLVAQIFIMASILGGLGDLFPYRTRVAISDGSRIWMLLRQKENGERWVALMKLAAELGEGAMPEALPAEYIAKAIAVRDNSADTVTAYSIAYSAAFQQHKDAEAGQFLEICLAHSGFAAPTTREALMSDAAVFQARRKKHTDIAEQWLAELPATTQFPGLRARTEAAIFEAHGETAAALKKLDEFEKAILTLPNPVSREISLRFLKRWKTELS
jgi:hypothetical protein